MGGAAAVLLLGGLAWWLARRRRGGAPAGAGTAVHPHPHMHHHGTGTAHVSIVPHVKDRFDLTEIVEQTGACGWLARGRSSRRQQSSGMLSVLSMTWAARHQLGRRLHRSPAATWHRPPALPRHARHLQAAPTARGAA